MRAVRAFAGRADCLVGRVRGLIALSASCRVRLPVAAVIPAQCVVRRGPHAKR